MAKPKKSPSPSSATEPQWKTVEKVVALLEQSLNPEARVRHNVKLPCLTTGHEEQCDVIIEVGQEPRITRTIVEVQKRNERVKPNDFRGWCQKLRDVGANRLICVSAQPFPKSIKDKVAKELGPTVLLVRLEALEANRWPFQVVNNAMRVMRSKARINNTLSPNPLLLFDPNHNPFPENATFKSRALPNVIQRDGHGELLPIGDLVKEGEQLMYMRGRLPRLSEGSHQVEVRWRPKGTSLVFKGKSAPIQTVRAVYTVDVDSFSFPFEISSYTQEGHTLAWVARAIGQMDGEDAEIRFTFVPTAEGGFSMSCPQAFGIKDGGDFFVRFYQANTN